MKKSGQEGFCSGFSAEYDYQWQVQDADHGRVTKSLLDPETEEAYKYPVPTEMGMAAMCAYYKIKKGLDIRLSPYKFETRRYLNRQLKKLEKASEEQSFGVICGTKVAGSLALYHACPLLVRLLQKSDKDSQSKEVGNFEIGMFAMDGTGSDYFYGYNLGIFESNKETRDRHEDLLDYKKEFPDNKKLQNDKANDILPLFVFKESVQVDKFSCRIDSVVKIAQALRKGPGLDIFSSAMKDQGLLAEEKFGSIAMSTPDFFHKSTQSKKILKEGVEANPSAAVRKPESTKPEKTFAEFVAQNRRKFIERTTDFSGKVAGEDVEVEKAAYLSHKAETYMRDAAELAKQDPEDFLKVMMGQFIAPEEVKRQMSEEFRQNFREYFHDRGGAAYEVGSSKALPQADELSLQPSPAITSRFIDSMAKGIVAKAIAQVVEVDKGR